MEKTLIFGHKSPDTDAICSAVAYADLKTQLGTSVEAVRLGQVNDETQYVLDYFKQEAPRLVETVGNEVSQVILVDHNEKQQSVEDRDAVSVIEVIDHHRISNFETSGPLYYRAEPVGCTATILTKMYKENGKTIPKQIAGLMLSAIISDTLLLKSPTCTSEDVEAARELADIAEVDLNEYGMKMLKAGADVSKTSAEQLISRDVKEFQMGAHKVEVAQVNVVDVQDVLSRKAEVLKQMESRVAERELDLFLVTVTNILDNNSVGLASGSQKAAVEQAFNAAFEDNQVPLDGIVSRKKQIVPALTKALT
ncbi:manganese-dependent inorganic pyrophosphatase [Alicyclobacillus sp. SO9]|uniref:manganese-dependent inorganic pyrophosphatase n=1 Tax=Alicyclobacillus sp. SO9 TaxID=2665646 RepID=UPI0018E8AD2A|nr:manganese-dependent inorganic pyrophosphatase [Alicyclobacillus sp. SO9]QQE77087.1 manganese-dependent inorganic pyrophosphatase [Alicyclobacillus sp. SO9]